MAVLTKKEAADLLDYEDDSLLPGKVMALLVPAIEEVLRVATGKKWGAEEDVDPLAKMVAGMLLVRWFEDSGQVNKVNDVNLIVLMSQLEAKTRS